MQVESSDNIHIRDASARDAEIIAAFNQQLALETEGKRLDAERSLRGAQLGLSRPDMCRYFLAECDGRAIGQVMITFEWSDWRAGVFWWIQSVYVHPDFRRRGVFGRLFEHIRAQARRSPDACGIRLYVEQHNSNAIATYTRLDLRPSGHIVYEQDWSES